MSINDLSKFLPIIPKMENVTKTRSFYYKFGQSGHLIYLDQNPDGPDKIRTIGNPNHKYMYYIGFTYKFQFLIEN